MIDKMKMPLGGGHRLAVSIMTLILGLFFLGGNAAGQQKTTSSKNQLVGTWMLVSAQNEKKADVFGPHPVGMLVFDATGHFTSQVMRGDLPKFASPNRTKATPEESQAVIHGYIQNHRCRRSQPSHHQRLISKLG
jgi:Lipocalin-like domain